MTNRTLNCLTATAALLLVAAPSLASEPSGSTDDGTASVLAPTPPSENTAEVATSETTSATLSTDTQPASTESTDSSEPQRPKMNVAVPPPPAAVQRTDYVHEGFYFRVSVGAGVLSTTLQDKDLDSSDSSTSFALGADVLVGGSPSPGFSFGGALLTDVGFLSSFDDSSGPVLQMLAGPFFDAFPNNKGGWHLGTMIGGAGGSVASDVTSGPLFGGGAAAWGGGDLWVAPDWSAGFNVRVTGAHMVGDGASATNFSGQFLITVLNH